MNTRIEAVAFDLDGLMFNTEDVYFQVGTELMRRRGCDYSQELCNSIMGRPPRECFEAMIRWHSLDDRWEDLATESEKVFIELLDGILQPMPGLIQLLDALERAAIPKAICTSSSRNVLDAVIGRMGWHDRFEFTLTAQDITNGKPNPEIYLMAAERFGVEPQRMAALEDSENGCKAAAASGALTIAVPADHSRHHDFSPANLVVDSLADARLIQAILGYTESV